MRLTIFVPEGAAIKMVFSLFNALGPWQEIDAKGQHASSFLESTTRFVGAYTKNRAEMSNLAPQAALQAGQVVGQKYVLDRMIGKGGMGEVWAGRNQRTGKRIALKVIGGAFASNSDARELFRREAMAASRVNHPNVVTVFDIVDHEGMTCIVMELLDGEPLNEYLAREGALSVERAAALLLPAMRGVATANAQGVVHRDLKPHNIFLCVGADGRMVTTKVLDFGSSTMLETAPGPTAATVQLPIVGTPAYMAPEHIAGAPGIDERADVYGFGVVFFEALTGQHPFPGTPGISLLTNILNGVPRSLASLRPDLPSEVVCIVERAMAKEPNDRFPNLDSFIRVVEEHLLPSSPLPKNMTPLAGVPIFQLSEQSASIENLAMPVVSRADATDIHETRALYTLPSAAGVGEAASATDNRTEGDRPLVATSVDDLPTLGRSLRGIVRKPTVSFLLFGAVLALVIWMAFPMPKNTQEGSPFPGPLPTANVPSAETVKAFQLVAKPSVPVRTDGPAGDQPLRLADVSQSPQMSVRDGPFPAKTSPAGKNGVPGSRSKVHLRSTHDTEDEASRGAPLVPLPSLPIIQPPSLSAEPPSPPSVSTDDPSPSQPVPAERLPPSRAGALSTDDF